MDKYYYKIYEESLEADWQQILQNSSDSWIFHEAEICNFIAAPLKAKNISLLVYNANSKEPIGVCPLFLYRRYHPAFYRKTKVVAESFYESGPALHDKLSDKKRRELIRYMGETLDEIVQTKKIDSCRIGSANLSRYCLSPSTSYTNPWHEMRDNWLSKSTAYYYLNLQKPTEQLKLNLETRARTIINKFEKKPNCYIRKATIQDVDIIYSVFLEASNRSDMPFHGKDNFEWFLHYKHAEHYIAFIDKTPACVIRATKYKNTACYAAGFVASDFVKSEIATYALWQCLLELQKQGIAHIDLGVEEFKPYGSKAEGIAKFKRSFGGELRYKFSIEFERDSMIKKIGKKLLHVV